MENINKIKCILLDYGLCDKTLDEAAREILLLFSVVGQSEQLLALAQYMCQHQNNFDGKTAKDYLQEFLSQIYLK